MIEEILSHQLSSSQERFLRKSIQGITIAAILIVSPFTVYNLLQGKWMLGLCSTFILCVISYTAWNTLAGRLSYKLNFVFLTPAILTFFWVSIEQQQVIGLLWCYPALAMMYFVLPERLARFANLVFLIVVVPRVFMVFDMPIALRAMATLISLSIFCIIFIRRLNAQQLELENSAATDPLTGLSNRMNLDRTLDNAIEQSHTQVSPLSILSLDLDYFKKVNDQYGHSAGDKVLEIFGGVLVKQTASSDELFRLGGEEFLVMLNDTGSKGAVRVAEKIHAGLAENQPLDGMKVTVSIGIATLKSGENRHDLLQRSDDNLYQAKSSGRNRTQI